MKARVAINFYDALNRNPLHISPDVTNYEVDGRFYYKDAAYITKDIITKIQTINNGVAVQLFIYLEKVNRPT